MDENRITSPRTRFSGWNWLAFAVIALLVAERLALCFRLGWDYTLSSDDLSYIKSGITFAKTGMITMHNSYPSAQIMPGMTWLIGLFSLILGEGKALWIGLKLLWFVFAGLNAWVLYRAVSLFAPRWCGILAILPLFNPQFAWTDNLILTETPFQLCFTAMVYYTLRMGKEQSAVAFVLTLVSYMAGLMLKANIAPYPVFALVYLLITGYDRTKLGRQVILVACAVLLFVVPWSVRNYRQFGAFIPLTYGAGNPKLLGTYQGEGWPQDDTLDYKTNVEDVMRQRYAKYYDENGEVPERYVRYLNLQADGIKANYRLKVWAQRDLKSLLNSYLHLKPMKIMRETYLEQPELVPFSDQINPIHSLTKRLTLAALIFAFLCRRNRLACCFALINYFWNVFVYALNFAYGRYNISLLTMWYLAMGLGFGALALQIQDWMHKRKTE